MPEFIGPKFKFTQPDKPERCGAPGGVIFMLITLAIYATVRRFVR